MLQSRFIKCFDCQTPVDESEPSCAYCGREVALEIAERDALSFLLRCISMSVFGGGALTILGFAYFLTGIGSHEKTYFLSGVLITCIAGLLWFASDAVRPTRVED